MSTRVFRYTVGSTCVYFMLANAYSVCACGGRTIAIAKGATYYTCGSTVCVRYMDGSVFEVGIQMGGNFVYLLVYIVMGVYLKLYAWVVKTGFSGIAIGPTSKS